MTWTDYLYEPGFWLLTFMVTCALISAVTSILLMPTRRRLRTGLEALLQEGDLSEGDKAWARSVISTSNGHHLLAAAPFAPFAILGALVVGAVDGWDRRVLPRTDAQFDLSHADTIHLTEGANPRNGRLWNDPRRKEIDWDAHSVETWNHPVAMVWIGFWLVLALPFLFVGSKVSGSMRPFVDNVWSPLRDPINSILSLAASRHI